MGEPRANMSGQLKPNFMGPIVSPGQTVMSELDFIF